jgi:HSP20 family molecular chaperone IbpA
VTEGRFGTLRRSIALPADTNVGGIQAQDGHGLLTILVPKASNAASRQSGATVANVTINASIPATV